MITNTRVFRRSFLYGLGTVLVTVVGFASGDSSAGATLSPPQTTVLLLPALDATKDAVNMLRPRQMVIRHRQQVEFIGRQFRVAGEVFAIRAAAESSLIDLASIADRSTENLDELARRTGADWVVHTMVQSAEANSEGEGFVVDTTLLVQIWDARRHEWILNRPTTSRVTGTGVPPMLFMRSLDAAAKESLQPLLAAVPVVVQLQAEDGVVDYLETQAAPVVGEAGKLFVPLTPSK